jgi:PAS domain S-box-containing protein
VTLFIPSREYQRSHGATLATYAEMNIMTTCINLNEVRVEKLKQAEMLLRQSQAYYQAIVNDCTELVIRYTPDLRLTFVNKACCDFFGKSREEMLGHSLQSIMAEADYEVLKQRIQLLTPHNPVISSEEKWILPDGRVRWLNWIDRGFFNEPGELIEVQGMGRDAIAYDDLKFHFVSMISHEFRTPLTVVQSASDLLQLSHPPTEDSEKCFQQIYTAIEYMVTLLDDLLLFSTIESGKLRFQPDYFSLSDLCSRLIEEFQMMIGAEHTLTLSQPNQAQVIWGDPKLFRQILTNLLANAIKYSPNGGKVSVLIDYQGNHAILRVKDEGIGIPEDALDRLFEQFYRARNVGDIPGSGLGLAIVQQCVDSHGGKIVVDSEVGIGTTITIAFPLHPRFKPERR